jgi:hypothetical protein
MNITILFSIKIKLFIENINRTQVITFKQPKSHRTRRLPASIMGCSLLRRNDIFYSWFI